MTGKQPTLFFAHPSSTYGTAAESRGLLYLSKLHPHHLIINPGSKVYCAIPPEQRLKPADADMLVFIPFGDRKISIHMAKQIQQALKSGHTDVHEMHTNIEGIPIPMVSAVKELDMARVLKPKELLERLAAGAEVKRSAAR